MLIGDAVHKVAPNQAYGANVGLESSACLANRLRSLLNFSSTSTETQLEQMFGAYQEDREPTATAYLKRTSFHLCAMAGVGLSPRQKFQSQHLFPKSGTRWVVDYHISPLQAKGIKLGFTESSDVQQDIRFPYRNTEHFGRSAQLASKES